jgi:aconitate hydratase 2/2-methylisocitrate dehydratase
LGQLQASLHAGSDVRVSKYCWVSGYDWFDDLSQELESMAATVISPIVDGAYQSGCHTASVWDNKSKANIPRLMKFMNDFGLITARDPKGEYLAMTDVIHKVLNDLWLTGQLLLEVTLIQECLKVLLLVLTQELLRLH